MSARDARLQLNIALPIEKAKTRHSFDSALAY